MYQICIVVYLENIQGLFRLISFIIFSMQYSLVNYLSRRWALNVMNKFSVSRQLSLAGKVSSLANLTGANDVVICRVLFLVWLYQVSIRSANVAVGGVMVWRKVFHSSLWFRVRTLHFINSIQDLQQIELIVSTCFLSILKYLKLKIAYSVQHFSKLLILSNSSGVRFLTGNQKEILNLVQLIDTKISTGFEISSGHERLQCLKYRKCRKFITKVN